MTSAPTIILERFIIMDDNVKVYDEEFHKGVNIIRGDHSVGKSTLLDLIFYLMGGELHQEEWKEPADECSHVSGQFLINNRPITLTRMISTDTVANISVYEDIYDEAIKNMEGWMHYGSRRSANKSSFSEMFFELLNWKQFKTDDFSNLTMHQVLRLIYFSQNSDSTKIFRKENPRGDSENTRKAISEFLLSFDNLEIHSLRQKLLLAERKRDKLTSEISAYNTILGDEALLTMDVISNKIESLKDEIGSLSKEHLEQVKNVESDKIEEIQKDKIKKIREAINIDTHDVDMLIKFLVQVENEISDSINFEKSLEFRLKSLHESKSTYESLGLIEFKYCPICFSPVELHENNDKCDLCKSDSAKNNLSEKYVESINEINYHMKQNIKIKEKLISHKENLLIQIQDLNLKINNNSTILFQLSNISSEREQLVEKFSKVITQKEYRISRYNEIAKRIVRIDSLRSDKMILIGEIESLNESIEILENKSEDRIIKVNNILSAVSTKILEHDLGNEYYFKDASQRDVEIDFSKDRWLLGGRVNFSESSNAIKKLAMHFSFLILSLKDSTARYPRFSIMDFECNDLNDERSHNIQSQIVDALKDFTEYQLIITTSKVEESLNNSKYGVGKYYIKNDYIINKKGITDDI